MAKTERERFIDICDKYELDYISTPIGMYFDPPLKLRSRFKDSDGTHIAERTIKGFLYLLPSDYVCFIYCTEGEYLGTSMFKSYLENQEKE